MACAVTWADEKTERASSNGSFHGDKDQVSMAPSLSMRSRTSSRSRRSLSPVSLTELNDEAEWHEGNAPKLKLEAPISGPSIRTHHFQTELESLTMQENEELHEQLREVMDQNSFLRTQAQDLEKQLTIGLDELKTANDAVAAAKAAQPANPMPRRPSAEFSRGDLLKTLDTHEDEIINLTAKLEMSETACEQLRLHTEDLEKEMETTRCELLTSQAQHHEDQHVIHELMATVQSMEEDLSRTQFSKTLTSKPNEELSQPGSSGGCSWRDELASTTTAPTTTADPIPKIRGHLMKKTPVARFGFRPYQKRYFVVEQCKVMWWSSSRHYPDHSKCCGSVDLSINPCTVEIDAKEADRFVLRPLEQVVVFGLKAHEHANGIYTRADFGVDSAARYRKDEIESTMLIFWAGGKWFLGPDTFTSNAIASRQGADTVAALMSKNPWQILRDSEAGKMRCELSGSWVAGSFTGAHTGRILEFSALNSEYDRKYWVEVIRINCQRGRTCRRRIADANSNRTAQNGY